MNKALLIMGLIIVIVGIIVVFIPAQQDTDEIVGSTHIRYEGVESFNIFYEQETIYPNVTIGIVVILIGVVASVIGYAMPKLKLDISQDRN